VGHAWPIAGFSASAAIGVRCQTTAWTTLSAADACVTLAKLRLLNASEGQFSVRAHFENARDFRGTLGEFAQRRRQQLSAAVSRAAAAAASPRTESNTTRACVRASPAGAVSIGAWSPVARRRRSSLAPSPMPRSRRRTRRGCALRLARCARDCGELVLGARCGRRKCLRDGHGGPRTSAAPIAGNLLSVAMLAMRLYSPRTWTRSARWWGACSAREGYPSERH